MIATQESHSNGHCFKSHYLAVAVVYLLSSQSLPSNRSTSHTAASLRLFVPNSVQAYHHFFSEGCTCNVCDWSLPSSRGLVLYAITSQLLLLLPSLRLAVPSGSLIWCELVHITIITIIILIFLFSIF